MLFEPESIERLSPAARVEVRDFYARKFLAEHERRFPERRADNRAVAPDPLSGPAAGVGAAAMAASGLVR